ncbi:MAG: hypothetical protein M1814_001533 [Vezdaea aestivalis]|nr:MAG: hypothetical protein M1814_001533 [Vezdaea aestivalis]
MPPPPKEVGTADLTSSTLRRESELEDNENEVDDTIATLQSDFSSTSAIEDTQLSSPAEVESVLISPVAPSSLHSKRGHDITGTSDSVVTKRTKMTTMKEDLSRILCNFEITSIAQPIFDTMTAYHSIEWDSHSNDGAREHDKELDMIHRLFYACTGGMPLNEYEETVASRTGARELWKIMFPKEGAANTHGPTFRSIDDTYNTLISIHEKRNDGILDELTKNRLRAFWEGQREQGELWHHLSAGLGEGILACIASEKVSHALRELTDSGVQSLVESLSEDGQFKWLRNIFKWLDLVPTAIARGEKASQEYESRIEQISKDIPVISAISNWFRWDRRADFRFHEHFITPGPSFVDLLSLVNGAEPAKDAISTILQILHEKHSRCFVLDKRYKSPKKVERKILRYEGSFFYFLPILKLDRCWILCVAKITRNTDYGLFPVRYHYSYSRYNFDPRSQLSESWLSLKDFMTRVDKTATKTAFTREVEAPMDVSEGKEPGESAIYMLSMIEHLLEPDTYPTKRSPSELRAHFAHMIVKFCFKHGSWRSNNGPSIPDPYESDEPEDTNEPPSDWDGFYGYNRPPGVSPPNSDAENNPSVHSEDLLDAEAESEAEDGTEQKADEVPEENFMELYESEELNDKLQEWREAREWQYIYQRTVDYWAKN